jgi:hypothetical protein
MFNRTRDRLQDKQIQGHPASRHPHSLSSHSARCNVGASTSPSTSMRTTKEKSFFWSTFQDVSKRCTTRLPMLHFSQNSRVGLAPRPSNFEGVALAPLLANERAGSRRGCQFSDLMAKWGIVGFIVEVSWKSLRRRGLCRRNVSDWRFHNLWQARPARPPQFSQLMAKQVSGGMGAISEG